jgi:hypothetical protein
VAESLGTAIFGLGDSDLSNGTDLFEETSNAIFVSAEAEVTTEDSGGGFSSLLTSGTVALRSVSGELNLENTSIKLGAVDSLEGLDSHIVFNVFDEGNTLEGEVLALGHLSEALEDFT